MVKKQLLAQTADNSNDMAIPPINAEAKVNIGTPQRSLISEKPELFQSLESNPSSLPPLSFWAGFNRFNETFADAMEFQLTGRRKAEELFLLFFMALSRLQTTPLDPEALAFFMRVVAYINSVDAEINKSHATTRALTMAFVLEEEVEKGFGLLHLPIPPDDSTLRTLSEAKQALWRNENIKPWEDYKKRVADAGEHLGLFDGAADALNQAEQASAQLWEGALRMVSQRMTAITRRASRFE